MIYNCFDLSAHLGCQAACSSRFSDLVVAKATTTNEPAARSSRFSDLVGDKSPTTKFIIVKVDTDEQQKLAGQHGVRGFPTFKLFRHGEVVEETFGAQSKTVLRDMIDRHR
jgi:hypothetical protein